MILFGLEIIGFKLLVLTRNYVKKFYILKFRWDLIKIIFFNYFICINLVILMYIKLILKLNDFLVKIKCK